MKVRAAGTRTISAYVPSTGSPRMLKRAALRAFVWSPVERWIDDDVASRPRGIDAITDFDDLAGSIRPENDRQLDARVLPLANPDVALIQRGGMEADDDLARSGMRIWTLLRFEGGRHHQRR